MKTYQFKLYNHKRNRHLHRQIDIAGRIYNHCIALHKRYYRLTGKSLNANRLKKHITKLKRMERKAYFNQLGSQAIQDVVERIDRAYKLFFAESKRGNKKIQPPGFRKVVKYQSFTLKQAGYKLLTGNYMRIGGQIYGYFKSRDIEGKIKTVTIKRDRLGDISIFIVTSSQAPQPRLTTPDDNSRVVGFDFGLKTFLTASDGNAIESPQFFKRGQDAVKRANRSLSRKRKGSNNRRKAHLDLARVQKRIKNQRADFHWKLANQITDDYDVIWFETLNLDGMKRLWGQKISDLGFYSFLQKVEYLASRKGVEVQYIDRWFPSSKMCHVCGLLNDSLELRSRTWTCEDCDATHNRDENAAINIERVGASTLGGGDVRHPWGCNRC